MVLSKPVNSIPSRWKLITSFAIVIIVVIFILFSTRFNFHKDDAIAAPVTVPPTTRSATKPPPTTTTSDSWKIVFYLPDGMQINTVESILNDDLVAKDAINKASTNDYKGILTTGSNQPTNQYIPSDVFTISGTPNDRTDLMSNSSVYRSVYASTSIGWQVGVLSDGDGTILSSDMDIRWYNIGQNVVSGTIESGLTIQQAVTRVDAQNQYYIQVMNYSKSDGKYELIDPAPYINPTATRIPAIPNDFTTKSDNLEDSRGEQLLNQMYTEYQILRSLRTIKGVHFYESKYQIQRYPSLPSYGSWTDTMYSGEHCYTSLI